MPKLTFYSEILDPHTRPERLLELANLHLEYAIGIAQNVHTPPQILEALSHRPEKGIRRSLTRNPNTPQDLLYKLARGFPKELLENPVWSLWHMENPNFIKEIPEDTLKGILKNPEVPQMFMDQMASSWSSRLQMSIQSNPRSKNSIAHQTGFRTAERRDYEMYNWSFNRKNASEIFGSAQKALSQNALYVSRHTQYYVGFLAQSGLSEKKYQWAEVRLIDALKNRLGVPGLENMDIYRIVKMPFKLGAKTGEFIENEDHDRNGLFSASEFAKALELLDAYKQIEVLKDIANNPHLPKEVLEIILLNTHPRVRAALCNNAALPLDLLERLENDPHTYVRARVAMCERAPVVMLERLFTQKSPRIKRGLCQNPNTPRVLLEQLRENATLDMQALLDANPSAQGIHTVFTELHDPSTSTARLLELWDFAELRVLIAPHPNAPLERIAAHFASSHQPLMRYIALRSLFLPRASLNLFVRSCMWQERLAVSMHPNVSYRQLSVLAYDAHSLIRAVASHRLEIEHTLK
jgi:hypothetical protein